MHLLYEDEHLVAVHKPAGLLVHRSPIDRGETLFLLQLVRDRVGRRVFPVHRLDKPTSGIVLFALDPDTARKLSAAFSGRQVTKRYLAVVRGVMTGEGTVDHPLLEEPDAYDPDTLILRDPLPAVSRFRAIATATVPHPVGKFAEGRYSLVEVVPETGRRRQIRRHLKHLSHPIIGDTTYGDGRHNRLFRDVFDCGRLLLAAVELALPHPVSGEPLTLKSPLEENFASVIRALGLSEAAIPWLQHPFPSLQD